MCLISSISCFHTINFAYEHQALLSLFQIGSKFCRKGHWFCWLMNWPWVTYVDYMWIQRNKWIQKNWTYFINTKKFCAQSSYNVWKSWYLIKIFFIFYILNANMERDFSKQIFSNVYQLHSSSDVIWHM